MITSYKTMPLGIYKKIETILKDHSESEDIRNVQIIALLAGKTEEEIMSMPFAELRTLSEGLDFLYEEPKIGKPSKTYKVGHYILTCQIKPEKLTTGQYIDFKELATSAGEHPEVLLSVFLVPKGKAYNDGYEIEEVQQAILEHLPCTEAQAILAFFLRKLHQSTLNTMYCSLVMMEASMLKMPKEKRVEMMEKIAQMQEAIRSYDAGAGFTTSTLLPSLPARLGIRFIKSRV